MATKQFQNAKLNVTHLNLKDDASRSVLQSGENISHSLGKIARWYKDIIWTDSKATTEAFGIVKLSDDYKSESTETVPTSKTLNDVVKLIKQTGGWNTTYDFNLNIDGDENLQNGQFKVTEHDLEGDIDHYVSIKGLGSAAYTNKSDYATADHTHKYAGSDSVGGPATSANKLNTDAGSDVTPIYFSNGIPVACTYSLNKTVPSNALFTDEKVKQTATTTDADYEILFSSTDDNTTRTEGARKNSNLTFNPSTGTLTATKFVGVLSGNATTATTANKLSNTTAIGSSIKPVYFSADGIPVAIDHSIETSVPSNAVFTDTTYTVSSGDSNGQIKVTPSEGDPYNVSVKGLGSAAYTDSDEYATADHTHKYAGSSSVGGVANSAAKLSDIPTAGIGSETKPVFFSGTTGRPVACTYSLNATVPANAIFTDEKVKQSPVTTDGSFEVLFAGSTGNTEKTEGVGKTTTLTFNPSTGVLSATSFIGNGSGLTTLNASNISSGTLSVNRLPGSAVTVGTYGPAAGGTLSHSGTFDVPDFTVDAKGRITGAHTRTFTLPAQYTHPTHTSKTSGLYKITVDSLGHVSGTAAVTKSDIPALDYISSTTTRNPNVVLAGPASGTTAAVPTFRALVAADLPASGATAGSYGPSANATPGYGATFNVPYITVDAKGRVTGIENKTVKIPASDNTNTTYTFATGDNNGTFKVTPSGGTATNISIKGLGSAAYTASSAYATAGHTHNYAGSSSAGGIANSAAKLSTARTINGVKFDGTADIIVPRSIKHIHYANGTNGTSGYVKICTVGTNAAYGDQPIRITIGQRRISVYDIFIVFENSGSAKATIRDAYFRSNRSAKQTPEVHYYLNSNGYYDIYVKKTESQDHIFIMDYLKSDGDEGDHVELTWTNTIVSTLPSGSVAMSNEMARYYDSKISRTANTVLAAPNGSAGSATFRALVAADLPASGATAGSYGPSANATPGYGATFNVPYITVDAKGRVTAISNKTVKIPASDNTNTTYTLSGAYGSGSNTWVTTLTPSSGSATTSTVPVGTTSAYGLMKLYNGVDSTSTALAATANAVKTAYDYKHYIGSTRTDGTATAWSYLAIKEYDNAYPDGMTLKKYGYGGVITLSGGNSRLELYANHNSSTTAYNSNGIQFRTGWVDDKKPWRMLLDNVNYSSYITPAEIGASASDHSHPYLPTAGGTMEGHITFAAVTSTSYTASSHAIVFSGSTDWAKILYEVRSSDAGQLVLQTGDDANARIVFRNSITSGGTATKEVIIENGVITGNGSGLTSLNASNISSGTLSADRLATSGATAGSYGPSANATPGYGATFNVPYITVDAKGRVTAISTKTVKIPASDNTNTTYTFATGDNNGTFKVTPSGGSATNIAIKGLGSAAYTASSAYATSGHTHGLGHSNFTVAIDSTTNTWAAIGVDGTNKYVLKSIRTNTNAPPYLLNDFSAGIVFGGEDTRGVISMKYNTPSIRFAGGNKTATDGGTAVWYITLTGTHNTTYSLDTINHVKQSATTTAKFRGIILGTNNTTNATDTRETTVTGQGYITDKIFAQPSTGSLYATNMNAWVSGTDDVQVGLIRSGNSSWRFLNSEGILSLQNNFYSDKVQSWYNVVQFNYGGTNAIKLMTPPQLTGTNRSTTYGYSTIDMAICSKNSWAMGIKWLNNARDTVRGSFGAYGAADALSYYYWGTAYNSTRLRLYVNDNGGLVSQHANGFRIAHSGYGVIFRNDGSDFYILLTDKKTDGSELTGNNWNDKRPLVVHLNSGKCDIDGDITGHSYSTTFLKNAIFYYEGSDIANKRYYRVAYAKTTNNYTDMNGVFLITNELGEAFGIIKVRARTEATAGVFGNTKNIKWIINSGFDKSIVKLVVKNNYDVDTAKTGTATAEIWLDNNNQWRGIKFTILSQGWRKGSAAIWTMSSKETGGSSEIASTGITSTINATNQGISNNAATSTIAKTVYDIDANTLDETIGIGYTGDGITASEALQVACFTSKVATQSGARWHIKDLSFDNLKTKLGLDYDTIFSGTAAASVGTGTITNYTRLVIFCKNISNTTYFTVQIQATTGYHYHVMSKSPPPGAAQTSNSFYGLLFNVEASHISVSAGKYSNLSSSASLATGPTVHITKVIGYKF